MYESGRTSNFKKGEVEIKAPQVRRLYFTDWAKNRTNPKATKYWFETTKKKHIKKYSQMLRDKLQIEVKK